MKSTNSKLQGKDETNGKRNKKGPTDTMTHFKKNLLHFTLSTTQHQIYKMKRLKCIKRKQFLTSLIKKQYC